MAEEKEKITPPTTEKIASESGKTVEVRNAEKVGTKEHSFIENIKNKWQAHIDKNKAKGKAKKEMAEDDIKNIDEFIRNFDPKRDKKKLTKEIREKIIEMEKLYQEGTVSIKDIVAPSSMGISTHDIRLNNQYVRSFYTYSYPRYLETNWLNQIINYDASLDISLFVYPSESSNMLKILKKKVAEMRSTMHMNQKKGLVESVSLETSLEDAQRLRVDLQRGKERFFQLGLYFTIYADSLEQLDKITKQIETLLGGALIMTRSADFRQERAFDSAIPQCQDELGVIKNMNTSPLSTTFPFVSNTLTSNRGVLYGLNRHNNSLIIFDRFELENANSVIFAKSGSGKSYAVKLEILRSMMMGTDVIVIDPENEYEVLSKTVGGTYTKISLTSEHRINPFDLPAPLGDSGDKTEYLLKENIINMTGLMNIMLGKLTPEEDALMDKALRQTYEFKGITPDIENPREYEMPTMVDLQNILANMEGGKGLAVRLEKYTKGTYSGIFSEQTNVDLGTGLICFCIRDLEDQLRPIAMYILLNFIWNRVRSELKKRMLVIDEAWTLVQYEDSGRFLHNLAKRARKYYLGVTTITQDVDDFLRSSWGKPIITNSSLQLLLKQAPSSMDILSKTFNLTKAEEILLLNSGVGQGVFFAGNQHVAIQVIASHGEHQIITTNPEELLAQQEMGM